MESLLRIKELLSEKMVVLIDHKLKFVPHIQAMVQKANRNRGIRSITFKCIDKEIFLNLYKALVRPHLEYAFTVLSVIYKTESILIENDQKRAARLVHDIRHLDYTERMKELGLPSLQYRTRNASTIPGCPCPNPLPRPGA